MDILYYSNYCKHSQKVIQFLVKSGFSDKLNFICIDKRVRDPKTNQLLIVMENGKQVSLPPNIHSVPSLLVADKKYQLILGDEIIAHYQPRAKEIVQTATQNNGEPVAFQITPANNGMSIVSEQYTFYDMTPEELSAKGKGGMRQMHNYVPASGNSLAINTPPDTYRPDKVESGVTLDSLQQKRNEEISQADKANQAFANYKSTTI
jgi:hypothetical protein